TATILALSPVYDEDALTAWYSVQFLSLVLLASGCAIAAVLLPPVPTASELIQVQAQIGEKALAECFGELVQNYCGTSRLVRASFLLQMLRATARTSEELRQDVAWEPFSLDVKCLERCRKVGQAACHLRTVEDVLRCNDAPWANSELHAAFVARLGTPLRQLVTAVETCLSRGDKGEVDIALQNLNDEFQTCREETLYSQASEVALREYVDHYAPIVNAFLLGIMQLGVSLRRSEDHALLPRQPGFGRIMLGRICEVPRAFIKVATLQGEEIDSQIKRGVKFSLSITLAATVVLLAESSDTFKYGIFAPLEVTFILFDRIGGSVNQSVLRILGTTAGSVYAYLALIVSNGNDAGVLMSLVTWSFAVCTARMSPKYGYAAICAAWTAGIVASGNSTDVALERIIHSFMGAVIMLVVLHALWPVRARDAVRVSLARLMADTVGLLELELDEWHALLGLSSHQEQSAARNPEVQADLVQEPASLAVEADEVHLGVVVRGAPFDDSSLRTRLDGVQTSLRTVSMLHEEACMEPELWHGQYVAEGIGAVVACTAKLIDRLSTVRTTISAQHQLPSTFSVNFHSWISPQAGFVQALTKMKISAQEVGSVLIAATDGRGSMEAALAIDNCLGDLRLQRTALHALYRDALTAAIEMGRVAVSRRVSNADMLLNNSLCAAILGVIDSLHALGGAFTTLIELDALTYGMPFK
ncbi:hypothetical protein CYMTET_42018, partial [Cymbomonas tetramitiformis]